MTDRIKEIYKHAKYYASFGNVENPWFSIPTVKGIFGKIAAITGENETEVFDEFEKAYGEKIQLGIRAARWINSTPDKVRAVFVEEFINKRY